MNGENSTNLNRRFIRKQNELTLFKLGELYAKQRNDALDEMTEEWSDRPDLTELDSWFEAYVSKLEAEAKRSLRRAKLRKYTPRVAAILMALLVATLMLPGNAEAFRLRFLNMFFTNKVEYNEVVYDHVIENKEVPENWEGNYYLPYLPEGYRLLGSQSSDEVTLLHYMNDDGQILAFTQMKNEIMLNVDNRETGTEVVPINDIDGYMTQKEGVVVLHWSINDMFFSLDGSEDVAVMIHIAEEIKKY